MAKDQSRDGREGADHRPQPAGTTDRRAEPPYVGENPKQPSQGEIEGSNRIKDPQDWVTGDEPMTGAQRSYLKTLSEQVHEPEAFEPNLDKADASQRIDDLKRKRDGSGT